jgi:hypothetical protein
MEKSPSSPEELVDGDACCGAFRNHSLGSSDRSGINQVFRAIPAIRLSWTLPLPPPAQHSASVARQLLRFLTVSTPHSQ